MEPAPLTFVDIVDLHDDRLLPWLDLYETAFPTSERVLVSTIVDVLKRRMAGGEVHEHLLSVLDTDNVPVGMAMYSISAATPVAFLWYMAVDARRRGQRIGTRVYEEIAARLGARGLQAMIFEVEIPHGDDANTAARRIQFYRRQGAFLLEGIRYLQDVGWHQTPLPMHLMLHPLGELDARAAFALAQAVFGDWVEQVGELALS